MATTPVRLPEAGSGFLQQVALGPLLSRFAVDQVGAARQQLRDLLECAWPAVLAAAADPLDSVTWRAAVTVTLARGGTKPAGLRRLGYARFARAVTVELGRWGGKRRCLRVLGAVWAAATDPAKLGVGVAARGGFRVTELRGPTRVAIDVRG